MRLRVSCLFLSVMGLINPTTTTTANQTASIPHFLSTSRVSLLSLQKGLPWENRVKALLCLIILTLRRHGGHPSYWAGLASAHGSVKSLMDG